jgi:hypothetical protein
MIAANLARTTVNQRISCIKRIFRWAVGEELIPPSVHHGLQAVTGLVPGDLAGRVRQIAAMEINGRVGRWLTCPEGGEILEMSAKQIKFVTTELLSTPVAELMGRAEIMRSIELASPSCLSRTVEK